MTGQLKTAWKSSAKPFHHETIYTDDLVPLGVLHTFISSIVNHIELYYPKDSLSLFDDWHAHDGFIVSPSSITLSRLKEHVGTPESLYQWRQGDFEVYRAIYPSALDFLLRINVLDEDDDPQDYPGIWGSMSFSGHGFDISEIRKRGLGVDALKLKQVGSKEYFDKIYGG